MAIYDDDFQGYSIGQSVPFGSWLEDPSAFTDHIDAGNGPSGTTRALNLDGTVVVDPTLTHYISAFSEFVAVRKETAGPILAFSNGPNGTGHTFTLLLISVEQDGTITASCTASGQFLGNTIDKFFQYYGSNFLQVNVTFSDVMVGAVNMVNIQCEIALNGVSVLSFNKTTSFASSGLTNMTAEVNRFQLTASRAWYAAYTLDTPQAIVSYPHIGSPKERINEGAIEILTEPDSGKIRLHEGAVEIATLPDSAKLRIHEGVIELILESANRWYIWEG